MEFLDRKAGVGSFHLERRASGERRLESRNGLLLFGRHGFLRRLIVRLGDVDGGSRQGGSRIWTQLRAVGQFTRTAQDHYVSLDERAADEDAFGSDLPQ